MKVTKIDNFESFQELCEKQEQQKKEPNENQNLVFLFMANDDPQTGQSWCCDCRRIKSVMEKISEEFKFNENIDLVVVSVGNREQWKDDRNPFKLCQFKVDAVPTLLSSKNVSVTQLISTRFFSLLSNLITHSQFSSIPATEISRIWVRRLRKSRSSLLQQHLKHLTLLYWNPSVGYII